MGGTLTEVEDRLPDYLREMLQEIQELLTELARVRGPALYGYEIEGISARDAFKREYAENTYHRVKEIVELCSKFLKTTKRASK